MRSPPAATTTAEAFHEGHGRHTRCAFPIGDTIPPRKQTAQCTFTAGRPVPTFFFFALRARQACFDFFFFFSFLIIVAGLSGSGPVHETEGERETRDEIRRDEDRQDAGREHAEGTLPFPALPFPTLARPVVSRARCRARAPLPVEPAYELSLEETPFLRPLAPFERAAEATASGAASRAACVAMSRGTHVPPRGEPARPGRVSLASTDNGEWSGMCTVRVGDAFLTIPLFPLVAIALEAGNTSEPRFSALLRSFSNSFSWMHGGYQNEMIHITG